MVPFCGVFLKELSDALDGTASIISLKPPLENSEDSLEVGRRLQDATQAAPPPQFHSHPNSSSSFQFVSDYSGQHSFLSRSGSDGLHAPEKEATVSNILQIIR